MRHRTVSSRAPGAVLRAGAIAAAFAVAVFTAPAGAEPEPAPTLPPPEMRAWQTGMLRADRLQHVSLAATMSMSCGLTARSAPAGLAFGLGLGVLKELWDARRDRFDWTDLAADAVGAGIGAAVTEAIRR